jgi:hypothetical protein
MVVGSIEDFKRGKVMALNCERCNKEKVCSILGECFITHQQVKELPSFLSNQIKNARSVKQALNIFNAIKYVKKPTEKEF